MYVIGHKQKIKRKTVPYMVALVVEDHGIIDLYFLYNFDNIPKKIKHLLIYLNINKYITIQ